MTIYLVVIKDSSRWVDSAWPNEDDAEKRLKSIRASTAAFGVALAFAMILPLDVIESDKSSELEMTRHAESNA